MLKNQDELEAIRLKVMTGQVDWKKHEKDCIKVVWEEIQEKYVGKKKTLDLLSCGGCSGQILSAVSIIKNYIMYHEPKQSELKQAKVRMVVEEPEVKGIFERMQSKNYTATVNNEINPSVAMHVAEDLINSITNKNDDLEKLSLTELRERFPHIKSNSVKGFIEKLNNY